MNLEKTMSERKRWRTALAVGLGMLWAQGAWA